MITNPGIIGGDRMKLDAGHIAEIRLSLKAMNVADEQIYGFEHRDVTSHFAKLLLSFWKAVRPCLLSVRPTQPGGSVRFPFGGPAITVFSRKHRLIDHPEIV